MLITKSISNSTVFTDVSRTINIVGITMNSDASTFDLFYRISYTKNGQDVTNLFNTQVPEWHISNDQLMILRDENFNAIPNTEFVEFKDELGIVINEKERYMTMPSFDYIKMMILDKNIPLRTLIEAYIMEEDKDGRFNF